MKKIKNTILEKAKKTHVNPPSNSPVGSPSEWTKKETYKDLCKNIQSQIQNDFLDDSDLKKIREKNFYKQKKKLSS
jgi:hypothetical protein